MPTLDVAVNARKAVSGTKRGEEAIRKLRAEAARLAGEVNRLDGRMDRMGRTAGRTGTSMRGLLGGLTGFAAVRGATRAMGGFEEAMARVRGVAIRTTSSAEVQERQFAALTRTARELGATTSFTASEAAAGLLNLARAGFQVEESIAGVAPALRLALVGDLDLAAATDILASSIRQFQLEAQDATRVVDVLTNTANQSNTDITLMAEAFKLAGPFAKSAGLSFEQTAAAIGVLADSALKGSIGGTNLRGVLIGLIDPSKAGAEVLAKLTDEEREQAGALRGELIPQLEQLAKANIGAVDALNLFNRRSVSGGLALIANVERLKELTKSNEEVRGIAELNATLIGETLPKRFAALTSAIEETVLATGDRGLLGALKEAVDFLTLGIRSLDNWDNGLTQTAAAASTLVKALGLAGLAGVVRLLASVLGGFGGAGLVLLIAGVVAAMDTWGGRIEIVTERLKGLRDESTQLSDSLSDLAFRFDQAVKAGEFAEAARLAQSQVRQLEERRTIARRQRAEGDTRGLPLREFVGATSGDPFPAPVIESAIDNLASQLADELVQVTQRAARRSNVLDRFGFALGPTTEDVQTRNLEQQLTRLQGLRTLVGQGLASPAAIGEIIGEELADRLTVPFEVADSVFGKQIEELRSFIERQRELTEAAARAEPGGGGPPGAGGGISRGGVAEGITEAFQAQREVQQEARKAIAEQVKARLDELAVLRVDRDLRGQAVAVQEALNIAQAAGLDLSRDQLLAIANQQRAVENARAEDQAQDVRDQVERRFGSDIATSIVDPIREGVLSGDFSETGEAFARKISQAFLDNLVFQPLTDKLAEVFTSIISDSGIAELSFQAAVSQSGIQFAGSVTAAATTASGAMTAAAAAIDAAAIKLAAASLTGSAQGNAFTAGRNLIPFARGGVTDGPQVFPLSGGRLGLRGEAGPEAVLPLRRGPDGDLGVVNTGGGGGGVINQTFHMTFASDDQFRRTKRQLDQDARRRLTQNTEGR